MKRILFSLLVLAVAAAACSEPTTPLTPTTVRKDEACRSGYHIATRSDGTTECVPDGDTVTGL